MEVRVVRSRLSRGIPEDRKDVVMVIGFLGSLEDQL